MELTRSTRLFSSELFLPSSYSNKVILTVSRMAQSYNCYGILYLIYTENGTVLLLSMSGKVDEVLTPTYPSATPTTAIYWQDICNKDDFASPESFSAPGSHTIKMWPISYHSNRS